MRNQSVIVGQPHEPLAFARRQATDRHGPATCHQGSAIAATRGAGMRFERRYDLRGATPSIPRHATLEANRDLAARVGVAAVMWHRAERWSDRACVRSMVLGRERRHQCLRLIIDPVHAASIQAVRDIARRSDQMLVRFLLACPERARSFVPVAVACGVVHGDYRILPSRIAVSFDSPPTSCKAWRKIVGNSFPRLAARRSMPAQAFALKKYRRGTPPVSKMSDNEDATAPLGHSEELSVQHSPGAPIPEFRQRPDDGTKVPSSVRRQDAGDVFPDDPSRPQSASKAAKLNGQVATSIGQAASSSSN